MKKISLLTWGFKNGFDKHATLDAQQGASRRQREPFRALASLLAFGGALCLLLFALQKNDKKIEIKPVVIKSHNYNKIDYQIYTLKELRSIRQFNCAITLWNRESNWRVEASNKGHYGIVQGRSDYLKTANGFEQIDWGLRYIKSRYGVDEYNKVNVCLALGHSYKRFWY